MFNRKSSVSQPCYSTSTKDEALSIVFRAASNGIQTFFEESMLNVQAPGFSFTKLNERDYQIDINLTNVVDFDSIRKSCQQTLSHANANRILLTRERSEISDKIEKFAEDNGFKLEQKVRIQPGYDNEGNAF